MQKQVLTHGAFMMDKEAELKKEETVQKHALSKEELEQVDGGWHSIINPTGGDKKKSSDRSGNLGQKK